MDDPVKKCRLTPVVRPSVHHPTRKMKTMKSNLNLALLALCAALSHFQASAATVVVPAANTSIEGNASNAFPFNLGALEVSSMRYQQIYAASEFASLAAGGEFITELRFRPDATDGAAFSAALNDIQFNLSTTTASPTTLSATFAANVGPNDTIVVPRGTVPLSSANSGPGAGPKAFDIVITLAVPFLYNPASGNLLLDVRNFSSLQTTTLFDAVTTPGVLTRVFAPDVSALSGPRDGTGLVTSFTTIPVPEPSTSTLLALALCGACASMKRLRKRA